MLNGTGILAYVLSCEGNHTRECHVGFLLKLPLPALILCLRRVLWSCSLIHGYHFSYIIREYSARGKRGRGDAWRSFSRFEFGFVYNGLNRYFSQLYSS